MACGGGSSKSPTAPTYPVGKPTGVDATPGSQSATVSWNAVPGASGYRVYISHDGIAFNRYDGTVVHATEFSALNLANGATYYFGVSALGSGGWESSISYPGGAPRAVPVVPGVFIEPDPQEGPPTPPLNLQGVAKESACEIHWERSVSTDVDYYRIYRAEGFAAGFSLWPLVVDFVFASEYRDEDLVNEAEYHYRITAVDTEVPALESIASNAVALVPMDFAPELLQNLVLYVNPGRILLEWDIPVEPDIFEYSIERVEAVEETTGAEVVTRFIIDKPVQPVENPHIYASGLVQVYVDIDRRVIVLQDMAVTVGVTYTYRVAAIDETEHEGPPATVVAIMPVF